MLLGKAHTAAGFEGHFPCQGSQDGQYSILINVLQRGLCYDRLFSGILHS